MPRDFLIWQFSSDTPHQQLIIEDLLEDEHTKPIVSLPDYAPFRFYAGAPFISSQGFSIETLCAMDGVSKTLKYNQIEGLRLLAHQIVSLIESEHYAKQHKESETKNWCRNFGNLMTLLLFSHDHVYRYCWIHLKTGAFGTGRVAGDLGYVFRGFDKIVKKNNIRKVKTIGDAYMYVGGISEERNSHAKNVCESAL